MFVDIFKVSEFYDNWRINACVGKTLLWASVRNEVMPSPLAGKVACAMLMAVEWSVIRAS